ncbi:peptide/nickel transport system substrate-binding protein [Allocatelliglobosispora scoriae]|uniref:Peptide/nickel transport system substrate-binding protein n=1 Tax=Allocatelliglobosispora scoriae TaxID=643052 RepID=A0A841BN36_9ACTN|nr:ABC transporter substrate-binding protein [Allocatelliglobosispora scoriae]MBB5868230.1 peptide/nickel transport system substrate-binding protein [Allocatelliglobosispora scoriae]
MSIRKSARLLAVTAVVGLLAACATTDGTSAANADSSARTAGSALNAEGTPADGGTLNLSMSADPLCLDPHAISSDVEQIFGRILTDNLVYLDKDGNPSPWLAEKWEISPDGKTYTFHLRTGVTFSDGAVFDAQAVVTNFEHMLDPDTRSPLAGPYIAPYVDSKIIDAQTLEVHLQQPYSPFLDVLAQGWLGLLSPKAIKESTPAQLCEKPVGSGPFVLTGYTKTQGATFVKRQGYTWAPPLLGATGQPHLDGINVSWVGQDAVRFNSLTSGQYQATGYVPAQNAAAVKASTGLVYSNVNRIGLPYTIEFNTTRAPFDDIKVRQAFVAAVNREAVVKTVGFGERQLATSFVDRVTKYYDPTVTLPGFDVKRANELLDQAGWTAKDAEGYRTKGGKQLIVQWPVGQTATISPIFDLIQAQVKAVGIKVNIELIPSAQLTTRRYDGDYDLSAGVWHTNTPDVLYIKYATFSIPNKARLGQNTSHLSDPQLDGWLDQARQTTDKVQLADLYGKVQHRLAELTPGFPVYDNSVLWAFSSKLHNVVVDTSHGTPYFAYAWLEK